MDKEMMNLYRDSEGNYRVEATFTIFDWLKIEQIMETAGTVAGQDSMNKYEMTRIAFNILPGQNSILHLFAESEAGADIELLKDFFDAIETVEFPNLTKQR